MDGIPDSRWDTRLCVGYQIVDGVPDRVEYQVGYQSGPHLHLTPLGGMKY